MRPMPATWPATRLTRVLMSLRDLSSTLI